jgi:ABC-type phosphate transport system substrate-binding protein
MPGRASGHFWLAALAALLAATLGAQILLARGAHATGSVPISGSGSSWSSAALDQWRQKANKLDGMMVRFSPDDSTNGRIDFWAGQVDFAVSDLPYTTSEEGIADPLPARPFGYLPIAAGGTALMYDLAIGDKPVTNPRLSGETIAKIFTQVITNWADPAIKADNPGLVLPVRRIVPVVRSDPAGLTAQFTTWPASQYRTIWNAYCERAGRQLAHCGPTSSYPVMPGMQAMAGSAGLTEFVAQGSEDGAMTYVEYAYARKAGFPVAKVLNAANYYVEPTASNVALALLAAKVRPDLTQDLSQVYSDLDPRAYPLSSYSYMIVPHAWAADFGTDKGRALSEFAYYAVCDGQQQVGALGYAPLPVNLVRAAVAHINQIPGATQKISSSDPANYHSPTLSADGTDQLVKNVSQPPPCDFKSALTQCASGTSGATAPTATTITLHMSPASPLATNAVVTLTATVQSSSVAGTVQFKDGASNIGGPVAVSDGTASTTTTLAPGNHSLTAVFTPTDLSDLTASTSPAISATVPPPAGAKATTTTFTVIPSGPVIQGVPVILVAQVVPANAVGTVQFMDGDTPLGTPRPVLGGFALMVTSQLTKGIHALTATFAAANPATFAPSAPPPVSLAVIGLS